MKVTLEGISETLMIPLWAKAVENDHPNPLIRDEKALKMLQLIDYDFSKFSNGWISQTAIVIRSQILDHLTQLFITKHKKPLIINIGAGLDTRYERLQNKTVEWIDLDLEMPIQLRRRFFKEHDSYKMIAQSVFDYTWINTIDKRDKSVLFIIEGVLMYFTEKQVKELMVALAQAFPSADMFFEMMTPDLVSRSKYHDTVSHTDAFFQWGIRNGRDVEQICDKIKWLKDFNYFDYHRDRWRWLGLLSHIPYFKNRFQNRIVHIQFKGSGKRSTL